MPPLRDGLRAAQARNTYTANGGRHSFPLYRKRYEDGSTGIVTSDQGIRRKPLRRLLRQA